MKKKGKSSAFFVIASISSIIFIVVFLAIVLFLLYFFGDTHINIKTKYGDKFKVTCDAWGDIYWIEDKNSDFHLDINSFSDKRELQPVCDNQYFRCYYINDSMNDYDTTKLYIFKIKKYDEFFYTGLYLNDGYYYMTESETAKVKNELLCDSTLMEICLTDLDRLYHDELVEMGEKFVNRDFDGLDKYGLSEDMISDTESLNEKITIMENYLKNINDFSVKAN